MTNYKQLGQEQRYVIDRLLRQGKSQKEIADVLGCHHFLVLEKPEQFRIELSQFWNSVIV